MKLNEHKSTLTLLFILLLNVIIIALYQTFYPIKEPNLKLETLRLEYSKEIQGSILVYLSQ